jgi:hypothetical protein
VRTEVELIHQIYWAEMWNLHLLSTKEKVGGRSWAYSIVEVVAFGTRSRRGNGYMLKSGYFFVKSLTKFGGPRGVNVNSEVSLNKQMSVRERG